ncbi:hypothetical protein BHE74_00027668 [Ensete ventricosum]|nr:hypothetical protein GW17_00003181 [Ensete ventricosum]RWW65042.1 hypothetical protein BHE74_00027668 [Ensete ventricosum]
MSKLLTRREGERVATIAALWRGQRLLATKSPRVLAAWGTLAARVSWPPEVTLRSGTPGRKDWLGGQGLMAAQGRLQPRGWLQRDSLGTRVSWLPKVALWPGTPGRRGAHSG